MTFAEIIPGLLEGKRYRVHNSSFEIFLDGELFIKFSGGAVDEWSPWFRDLKRDDWEECE